VDVIGATHTHFANICDIANALISVGLTEDVWPLIGASALIAPYHETCLPPAFSIDEATRIENLYAAAFFRRHLLHDASYDPFVTATYAQENEPFVTFFDPPPQAVSVDSALCYKVRPARGDPATTKPLGAPLLTDTFLGRPYDAKRIVSLCIPASHTFGGVTASPTLPSVHQEGYRIRRLRGEPRFTPRTRTVHDAFGTLAVRLTAEDRLLVRARAVDLGTTFTSCGSDADCGTEACIGRVCVDPSFPSAPPAAAGVDNFKCYRVGLPADTRFAPITGGLVQVQDRFGGPLAYDMVQPRRLCTPVDADGQNPGADTHGGHLMCYQVLRTPETPAPPRFTPHIVAVANTSFPNARLQASSPIELCIPALIESP
jgi:hypothetical protein